MLQLKDLGDRINLNNELTKIENLLKTKKILNHNEIIKITNLAEKLSCIDQLIILLQKKNKTLILQ